MGVVGPAACVTAVALGGFVAKLGRILIGLRTGPAALLLLASAHAAGAAGGTPTSKRPSACTTYHVAPPARGGNDENPGTPAQPWATLGKANATLTACETVLIHAGTYTQQIRPANSGGDDAHRITYRAAGDGTVTITGYGNTSSPAADDAGCVALGSRSWIAVDGANLMLRCAPGAVDFRSLGNFNHAAHNLIDGVEFDGSQTTCGTRGGCSPVFTFGFMYTSPAGESQYNVIRRSHLIGRGSVAAQAPETEDIIQVSGNAHHNVIDGNTLANTGHSIVNIGQDAGGVLPSFNVVRGNVITNPYHTALEIYGGTPSTHLVERNVLTSSGASSTRYPGNALQHGAVQTIVRYNVIRRGGSTGNTNSLIGGLATGISGAGNTSTYIRAYHNTIVTHGGPAVIVWDAGSATPPATLGLNRFVNNFVYDASWNSLPMLAYYNDRSQKTADVWVRNVFGNPGGASSQAIIRTAKRNGGDAVTLDTAISTFTGPADPAFAPWNGYGNVYDAAPGFVDYAGGDYHLSVGSAYIDAGAPLTQVAAGDSGSGPALVLDDARCFSALDLPAWMGVANDVIAVGPTLGNATVISLTAVNYAGNTVTLARPITRSTGDFVWLWTDSSGANTIRGSGPDVGAFETGVERP